MNLHYDVAFSYSNKERWIAEDLHDLITASGVSVYCYGRVPDAAHGILRDNLRDIYNTSALNLLLWSESYDAAPADSFPAMERRFLVHRHINKGEAESLLTITTDDHDIPADLELTFAHDLRNTGLFGIERFVLDRLLELGRRDTPFGPVFHPPPTDKYRGILNPCEFTLHQGFQRDPLNRWRRLADLWVNFPNDYGTKYVYLIPSGLCAVYLRHTARFLTNPDFVEAKRLASEDFVTEVGNRRIAGFWFLSRSPRAPERDVVAVYSGEYDRYLNEHFEAALARVRQPAGS